MYVDEEEELEPDDEKESKVFNHHH